MKERIRKINQGIHDIKELSCQIAYRNRLTNNELFISLVHSIVIYCHENKISIEYLLNEIANTDEMYKSKQKT